jgi:hypothetical protein
VLRLPEPMLARSGSIPAGRGWLFEPKLDGYRLLACTHADRFRARSGRGWNMTALLPELAATLPANLQLDGELVACSTPSSGSGKHFAIATLTQPPLRPIGSRSCTGSSSYPSASSRRQSKPPN